MPEPATMWLHDETGDRVWIQVTAGDRFVRFVGSAERSWDFDVFLSTDDAQALGAAIKAGQTIEIGAQDADDQPAAICATNGKLTIFLSEEGLPGESLKATLHLEGEVLGQALSDAARGAGE